MPPRLRAVPAILHRAPPPRAVLRLVEKDPGALVVLGEATHPDRTAAGIGEEIGGRDGDRPQRLVEIVALLPAEDVGTGARDDLAVGQRRRELAVEEGEVRR